MISVFLHLHGRHDLRLYHCKSCCPVGGAKLHAIHTSKYRTGFLGWESAAVQMILHNNSSRQVRIYIYLGSDLSMLAHRHPKSLGVRLYIIRRYYCTSVDSFVGRMCWSVVWSVVRSVVRIYIVRSVVWPVLVYSENKRQSTLLLSVWHVSWR